MKNIFSVSILFIFLIISGCSKDDNPVTPQNDIPADPTNVTVPATIINNITPTAVFAKASTNPSRIQMNLTGLVNPVTLQPITLTAQQNIFVTEDGTVKGLKVTKVGSGTSLKADIVFTIDISGSMGEEADSVAGSIIKFAQKLQASGLDVQFGCIGYYGDVEGAINFTNAQNLEKFLNRSTGTNRAYGFSGADSAKLEDSAYSYASNHSSSDENGVVGIFFANKFFSWRAGAQKIFINFTDEPTQPSGLQEWSTAELCSKLSGNATVHTVWSGYSDTSNSYYYWTPLQDERPWDMSTCTGGTVVFVPDDATGLDLSNLPVTGALSNSYLVEFMTSGSTTVHDVIITIKESNADGKRVYENITY